MDIKWQEKGLAEKAKSDPKAFAELYELYFDKIFRYVAYRVGRREDTEDIVADIFEKALKNIHNFKWHKDANFGSWLFRIAHNRVIDYYRSHKNKNLVNLIDLPEIAANEILPDDTLKRKELFCEMQDLIKTLPPKQAEIVALRFFGERKNKEIAKMLQVSEKTIASNLCRALKNLHQKYIQMQ